MRRLALWKPCPCQWLCLTDQRWPRVCFSAQCGGRPGCRARGVCLREPEAASLHPHGAHCPGPTPVPPSCLLRNQGRHIHPFFADRQGRSPCRRVVVVPDPKHDVQASYSVPHPIVSSNLMSSVFYTPCFKCGNMQVLYIACNLLLQDLGLALLVIPLLGFLESIAIAKAFGTLKAYELIAQQCHSTTHTTVPSPIHTHNSTVIQHEPTQLKMSYRTRIFFVRFANCILLTFSLSWCCRWMFTSL